MIYFLILCYKKEECDITKGHIYPGYLTCYGKMTGQVGILGEDSFGVQSGFRDALKFKNYSDIEPFLERAEKVFGSKYEFETVEFDSRMLGRVEPLYVVN